MTRRGWTMKGPGEHWTRLLAGDYEYPHTLRGEEPKARKAPKPLEPVVYGPFRLEPVYRIGRGVVASPRFVGYMVIHADSEYGCRNGPFYRTVEDAKGFARLIAEGLANLRNLSPIDEPAVGEVAA